MKVNANIGYFLRLTVTLLLITALAALCLSGVNAITYERIAENKVRKTQQAMELVLPGAEAMEQIQGANGIVQAIYAPAKTSAVQGYAVEVKPSSGFGGDILMIVGIDAEGKVSGISIISHAETPGLGAVAAAQTPAGQNFRQSFVGKTGTVAVSDIDAISSATITSKAVAEGVTAALAAVADLGKEAAQ